MNLIIIRDVLFWCPHSKRWAFKFAIVRRCDQKGTSWVPRIIINRKINAIHSVSIVGYFQCLVWYFRTKEVPNICPLVSQDVCLTIQNILILWQKMEKWGHLCPMDTFLVVCESTSTVCFSEYSKCFILF